MREVVSEQELQAELDVSFGPRQRAGYFAEVCIAEVTIREVELRRVEEVEYFRPELQSESLRKRKVFECRKVQIPQGRPIVRVVASDVALR